MPDLLACLLLRCCRSVVPDTYPFQRVGKYPLEDDAFNTIMKWLYSK